MCLPFAFCANSNSQVGSESLAEFQSSRDNANAMRPQGFFLPVFFYLLVVVGVDVVGCCCLFSCIFWLVSPECALGMRIV